MFILLFSDIGLHYFHVSGNNNVNYLVQIHVYNY